MHQTQAGFAHILSLLLLIGGLLAGVYLVQNKTNLFSRAASGPISSPVGFSNLSANFQPAQATFTFQYSGGGNSRYHVDLSTTKDMSWDVYLDFALGAGSPIVVSNPTKWDKYSCGKILYWRIYNTDRTAKSPIQSTTVGCGLTPTPQSGFSQLSASFPGLGPATYKFNYGGSATYFSVHMATTSNMSWDVYWNFGGGSKSPVVVTNPTKWDKYSCGRILYWKITSNNNESSAIQSTPVICSTPTPTLRPTVTPTPTPQAAKRVFVTSTTYNGNLGGLVGADAKCQARASAANLGGTWKAWLSDSTGSPSSRFTPSTLPYKRLDGVVVAANFTALITSNVQNPVAITELKTVYAAQVWTNTNSYGNQYSLNSCNNWTTAQYTNLAPYVGSVGSGNINPPGTRWTTETNLPCSYRAALYCFEQ